MATIHDIAQISGYSIGTVSRVINGRSGVSDEARTKIEAVIKDQGYQPNSNAKMLRQSVSSEISIIVRGINNIFLQSILVKVQARLREYGETANVHFIDAMDDEMQTALQVVQEVKPKGLVFLGGGADAFRNGMGRINIPGVLVAASAEELGVDNLSSFTTDDRAAAAFVASVLVSQGHSRVGILGGYSGDVDGTGFHSPIGLRIQGAIGELRKSGIPFDPERDFEGCRLSAQGGYDAVKHLLMRTPDLTAIFAISDSLAIGALRALKDMGLRVPEDVSVVGFDGVTISEFSIPRLATIEQDTTALANKGVDDLLMRLSYDRSAVHETVPYTYVHGESVARPRRTEEKEVGRWQR